MLKDVNTVFIDEFKQSFRNKKFLFLIIVLILVWFIMRIASSMLVILYVIIKPANMLPHTILMPFYLSYIILPVTAIIMSYDSIAEETQKHHVRYLASKISRSSIFLGKFLNNVLLLSVYIIILFSSALITTYFYSKVLLIKEAFLIVIQLIAFTIALLSITMLCSTISKTTHGALKLCIFLLTLLIITAMNIKIRMLSLIYYYPAILNSFIPVLIFMIYIIICTLSALVILERKDL